MRAKRLPRSLSDSEMKALLISSAEPLGSNGCQSRDLSSRQPSLSSGALNQLTTLVAVEVLFSTGIRVSELTSIKLKDMSLEEGTILIHGKGDQERRVFISDSNVKELIVQYLKLREHLNVPHDSFLINSRKRPASSQFIRKLVRDLGETAGLSRKVTPHMFRHSCATHLLEAGVDIRYVQRLLGHQSIATTQIYTKVSDKSLKEFIVHAAIRKKVLSKSDDN